MKRRTFTLMGLVCAIGILVFSTGAYAQESYNIPSWIKNNAKWWHDGSIGDGDFIKGIQYLIQNGMMTIPNTQSGIASSQSIPSWVKANAGWWASGQIDDSEFVKGIQYLVQEGIIQVNMEQPTSKTESISSETMPSSCTAVDDDILPDPKCTPGVIDPSVTQDNIDSTICVSGYTKTVRPPVSVTEPQKLDSMKRYGFDDSPSNYEFDHLIPLELGGAPDDLKNLWPEPHPSSYDKDGFENYLHKQVCSGEMDLKTAQDEIATNWYKYWNDAGQP